MTDVPRTRHRDTMFIALALLLVLAFDGIGIAQSEPANEEISLAETLPNELQPENFAARDIVTANTMMETLHVADWLGPLAPVALSPFFALTCLSGLSIWGPEWLHANPLLSSTSPLQSSVVFYVLLGLTVMTSVPRLTKVSKPFAQAMDQLETYSVIVILLVIKFLASPGEEPSVALTSEAPVMQAGFLTFSAQALLAIAMVINLIVINSVRFFFEVLIWLTPIPAIDACFEFGNKAACAGLMTLYAFSPLLATIVNFVMLAAALIMFRWISRRMTFYRTMFLDPLLAQIWKPYGHPTGASFVAFPKDSREPFAAKTRWRLNRKGERWLASRYGLMGKQSEEIQVTQPPVVHRGWIIHTVTLQTSEGQTLEFQFSRRYDGAFEDWAGLCGFELPEQAAPSPDLAGARVEFG